MEMTLYQEGFDPGRIAREETLFHTANGYLGVRACLEEDVPGGVKSIRGAYLNGFYNLKPLAYGERLYGFPVEQEAMVNVVDVQTIRLRLGDEVFTPFEGTVRQYSRKLDMGKGVSLRHCLWTSPAGKTVEINIQRMACFAEPSLFLIRYGVRSVDYAGPLSFESIQNGDVTAYHNPDDPRTAQEAIRHLRVSAEYEQDGFQVAVCETLVSGLAMACAVGHRLDGARARELRVDIQPGQEVVLEKICVFADSRRVQDPAKEAVEKLSQAMEQPWEHFARQQAEYLDRFWESSRVVIQGNEAFQGAVDFSLYQLLQSAGRDSLSNVCAKGLSGEGYEGHYFWDTEIFIFPFFLLTDHQRARNLLQYRYGILDATRKHARTMGHSKGALYPWRTIAGRECSGYYPSGSAQYHINADVAHSVIQYWRLTHDVGFMAEMGAEVLVETARLWLDVGHMHEGKFHIHGVTGPDEYTCLVNNNYYTNIGAKENLLMAARVIRALDGAGQGEAVRARLGVTDGELSAFEAAAQAMILPYDPERRLYMQDDSFLTKPVLDLTSIPRENFPLLLTRHPLFLYRHQVLKQADVVLAHVLYGGGVDEDDMRRGFDYYEPLTTHDSSLSPCAYGILAARLGDMKKAMGYFGQTLRMDLDDTHGNTADGIHTANLGGVYLGVVMGLAGLRISDQGVSLHPQLPPEMEAYEFPFLAGSSRVRCRVTAQGCTLSLLEGEPVEILLNGEKRTVT